MKKYITLLLFLSVGPTAMGSHNLQNERLNFLNTRLCTAQYTAWKNKNEFCDIYEKKSLVNNQDQQSALDASCAEVKYLIIKDARLILGSSQQDLVNSDERLKAEFHNRIDRAYYNVFFDQSLDESIIEASQKKIRTELHNIVDTIFAELTDGQLGVTKHATKPPLNVEEMETQMNILKQAS